LYPVISRENGLKQKRLRLQQRKLHDASAQENCEEDERLNQEALEDIGLECKCDAVDGGVTLICADTCAYCNADESVCGINSAQAFYELDSGKRTAIGGVFQYIVGLHDLLAVENLGCVEDENGRIISCETCNVFGNNQRCNSCEFQTCEDGRVEEIMDCSNIEQGAVFDFCQDVTIEEGIFKAFSTNEFKECTPLSLLEPITSSLSTKKSSKSSKKSAVHKFDSSTYSRSAKKMKSRRHF
jgi:hypothetical protein